MQRREQSGAKRRHGDEDESRRGTFSCFYKRHIICEESAESRTRGQFSRQLPMLSRKTDTYSEKEESKCLETNSLGDLATPSTEARLIARNWS